MAGIYLGPMVVERDIALLLIYPRWVKRQMEKYFKTKRGFIVIFLLIFTLNNISIFSSILSGFLIILPPFAAILTGLNVAIISYELMGWQGIFHILVNPVAWLEFPAAWLGFALAFQLAQVQLTGPDLQATLTLFNSFLPVYLKYIMTLLLAAAILETVLIVLAEKFEDDGGEQ